MDHPPRRTAHAGRRLRRPQRGARSARPARGLTPRPARVGLRLILIAGIVGVAGIAPAAPGLDGGLSVEAGLFAVDNPFFEPLDPTLLDAAGEPSTAGLSGQASLGVEPWLRWRPGAAHRVDLSVGGHLDAWWGDARTWAGQLDAAAEYAYRLGRIWALTGGLSGSAAAIDAFADDDLWWAEARGGLGLDLGRHRIDAGLGLGRRALPERTFVTADGATATGRDDDLIRARASHCARWSAARWCSSVGFDAVSVSAGGDDYDTASLATALDVPLGPVDGAVHLGGWRRAFTGEVDRADLGGLIEMRVARALADGLTVAGRYRYLRSTSDAAVGAFAQHLAGVELRVTLSSVAPRPLRDPRPAPHPDGWTFRYRAPEASAVALVGDFGGWTPEPMRGPDADGWWTLTRALTRGRHTYMFVVDGQFVRPPHAPAYADDGFGGEVGVIYVVDPPAADTPPTSRHE